MSETKEDVKLNNIMAGAVMGKDEITGKDIFLRRLFRNERGSWDKTEELVKEINKYSAVMDALAVDFVACDKKLQELNLLAYSSVPQIDCLFYDSPASPVKQTFYLRAYLKKLGWNGVRDIHMEDPKILTFTRQMQDVGKWLLKFKPNGKN